VEDEHAHCTRFLSCHHSHRNYWHHHLGYQHRRTGQFFLEGLSHLCPKNISTATEKTDMRTCKITLPYSPFQIIISRSTYFGHFILLGGMNSVFSFNKYKKYVFVINGCRLLPENLAFARKIMALPDSGLQPPYPPWLVRLCQPASHQTGSSVHLMTLYLTITVVFYPKMQCTDKQTPAATADWLDRASTMMIMTLVTAVIVIQFNYNCRYTNASTVL